MSGNREPAPPRIARVKAQPGCYSIEVWWLGGAHRGTVATVDISSLVQDSARFSPLWDNPELWLTAHPAEEGRVVSWGDNKSMDIAASTIEELIARQRIRLR